jgi:hypothetical protein
LGVFSRFLKGFMVREEGGGPWKVWIAGLEKRLLPPKEGLGLDRFG